MILGWSAWNIATGVGLLKLRNWARVSILIVAGLMAFFGTISLIVVGFIPIPEVSGSEPDVRVFVRVLATLIYGIPVLIGVWWLILFNRKRVREEFAGSAPQELSPGVPAPSRRGLLGVTIVGWFLIVPSILALLFVPFSMRLGLPTFVFGRIVHGIMAASAILAGSCALQLAAGIGLVRRKTWSYPLAIALQLFWLTSGFFTFLSPGFQSAMQETTEKFGNFPPETGFSDSMRFGMKAAWIGLLVPLLILGVLIYQRKQFFESAEADSKNLPT
jgi:predicted anti-sigma-YlaC factor YlaD